VKLFVTGGLGYIGGVVVTHHLVQAGHEIEIPDDLSTSSSVQPRVADEEGHAILCMTWWPGTCAHRTNISQLHAPPRSVNSCWRATLGVDQRRDTLARPPTTGRTIR